MARTNGDATAPAGSGAQRRAQTAKLERRSGSTPKPQSKPFASRRKLIEGLTGDESAA
jgi:hypothetical protein